MDMPSMGQKKPRGQPRHEPCSECGWYEPAGHKVKLFEPESSHRLPLRHYSTAPEDETNVPGCTAWKVKVCPSDVNCCALSDTSTVTTPAGRAARGT